jgi:ABC-type antimicrobial peptide transport system permease subunit
LRNLFTIFAIAISIAVVIGLISITIGLRESVKANLDKMGQNTFVISSSDPFFFRGFTDLDITSIKRISDVKDVVSLYVTTSHVKRRDINIFSRTVGLYENEKAVLIEEEYYEIHLGPTPSKVNNPISLGFSIWKQIGEPHLLEKIEIVGLGEYKLESVFKSTGNYDNDFSVYLPLDDVWSYRNASTYSSLMVFVSDPSIKGLIKENLERSRGSKDFSISDNKKVLEDSNAIISLLDWFFVSISIASVLISGVGIANTFYMEVNEKREYVGILKALGATNQDITTLFLVQSIIIGGLGGFFGLFLGNFIGIILSGIANQRGIFLNPVIPNWLWIGSIFIGTGIGALFGTLPAKKASELNPLEVLR